MPTDPGNAVLRDFRVALGLTQQAFGKRCGLHRSWLCQLERGPARIGLQSARKIIKAYRADLDRRGITLEDLLRGGRAA